MTKQEQLISTNPLTSEVIWRGSISDAASIAKAADSARFALRAWSSQPLADRIQWLERYALAVKNHQEEFAKLIALETSKPLWEARVEVQNVINKAQITIEAHKVRNHEEVFTENHINSVLRYKPHGVVVVLGPFNFPAHLPNGHIMPALLAGNTVLFKPSEETPATGEFLVKLWHEIGLPAGVIQCIQGRSAVGKILLNQDINGVFFTGSYQTGVIINQQLSARPDIILALEMGGNNPLIVDYDVPVMPTVYNLLLSCFITAGQRCTCARRVFIPNTQDGNIILQAFINATSKLIIGDPFSEPQPFMGGVISAAQANKHLRAQQELLEMGGKVLLPMQASQLLKDRTSTKTSSRRRRDPLNLLEIPPHVGMTSLEGNSALLTPGIIDMTAANNVLDEEIFAPLVQVYRYDDFEHAIFLANQTKYGLIAGLCSNNPKNYQAFLQQTRTGLLSWNRPTTGASSKLPFGGVGCSGNHRPSAYWAADYCTFPVASQESQTIDLPSTLLPGIQL